ncbi:MAG: hypothetical protein HC846_11175 [Blastocatellia bacterium]|nr:hypothetical protein [Blastocatellia bacterium]
MSVARPLGRAKGSTRMFSPPLQSGYGHFVNTTILEETMKLFFKIALILLAVSAFAFAQTWTPEMQIKTKALASPNISPDGKKIVYTVSYEMLTADKSEYVNQIHLASTDGTNPMQLTFADKSSSNPKWSPDGTTIAFTSPRKDNKSNIYIMRLSGGEAEMITDVKGNVQNFEWSPDGKWFAFSMTDAKTEEEEKNAKGAMIFVGLTKI